VPITEAIWDFDGTIVPFDTEQALLRFLSREPENKMGRLRALWGRALAWSDAHQLLEGRFKRLYARCLRGLTSEMLDALAAELARAIPLEDRLAMRAVHGRGLRMSVISCGTGDLCERTLKAAELADCFADIQANRFTWRAGRIQDITLTVNQPEDKVSAAERAGIDLRRAVVIGDGFTDVPLLDRAALAILVDRSGKKAAWAKGRGYRLVRSLVETAGML
jgi:phosphoserine phosphatase